MAQKLVWMTKDGAFAQAVESAFDEVWAPRGWSLTDMPSPAGWFQRYYRLDYMGLPAEGQSPVYRGGKWIPQTPLLTLDLENDFGAPTDGSSAQSELQTAVNQIVAAGGGRLTLRRLYNFDSIVWPVVGLDKAVVPIELVGPSTPNVVSYAPGVGLTAAQGGDMPAPTSGAILKASQASGSAFGGLTQWSNLQPTFRDLIVRTPPNSQWHGIENGWCTNTIIDGVVVDTGRSYGDGSNPLSPGAVVQPTNAGVYGVMMPGAGNGGVCIVRDLLVTGFYHGLLHSEHFDGDRVTLFKNVVAHVVRDGYHAARAGRMSYYWNGTNLTFTRLAGPTSPLTRIAIQEADSEETPDTTAWYFTKYHVDDPGNLGHGPVRFHRMIPNVGPVPFLRRRGGVYLDLAPLGSPPRQVFDVVGFDPATAANAPQPTATGVPANVIRGTWGISAQEAYLSAVTQNGNGDLVVWETGTNQIDVHTRIKTNAFATRTNLGVALCAVDGSNMLLGVLGPGTASIQKIDTSAYSNLSGNVHLDMANAQSFDVHVVLQGHRVRVYVDGALLASYTLSAPEWAKYSVATQHGLWAYTAGYEDGTSRWNFVSFERPGLVAA